MQYFESYSYEEWWRDWPNEARQPLNIVLKGAKSCKRKFGK